ncbi:MAG: signal peptidase II [Nitrospirota bacterium]|nr:MAG: signal peptidase II [Nitrospirota bacterium]
MRISASKRILSICGLTSLSIVIFDQFTKGLVMAHIMPYEAIYVLPFFNIVNVANRGAAFGSLQSLGNPFFVVLSLVAVVLILYLLIKEKENPLALSFILGGAIGNLIDRIRLGFVVDFLDLFVGRYHWPAFNVADSFLTIGISIILFLYIYPAIKRVRS